MILQQLQNCHDNVVNVTEATGLELLGVVEAAGPVDGDVRLVVHEFLRGVEAGAGVARAEVVEAVEHRTVRGAHVVVGQALAEALDVAWRHPGQELNVLLGVKPVGK